jgi:tetratricopeptide (TPR) repeat protein
MPDQIFISYRRDDAAYVTGHINDLLRKEFGNESVFTDVDNIALGVDFRAVLDESVSQCQVLLAVIGDNCLTVKSRDGKPRLHDPADFVRIEIESALKRNIPVIPLLVSGAAMPLEEDLPGSLKDLAFRNGTQIRPAPDFNPDMDRLIRNLRAYLRSMRDDAGGDPGQPPANVPNLTEEPVAQSTQHEVESKIDEERSERPGPRILVGEEDNARKQVELGLGHHPPKKRLATRLSLVAVVALAGGSWYYADQNPEQVRALFSAPQPSTSEAEDSPLVNEQPESSIADEAESADDVTVGAPTSFSAAAAPDAAEDLAADTTEGIPDVEGAEDLIADLTDGIPSVEGAEDLITDLTDGAPAVVDAEDAATELTVSTTAIDDAEASPEVALDNTDVLGETSDENEVTLAESVETESAEPEGTVDGEVVLTPRTQRRVDVSEFLSEGVSLAAVGEHEAAIQKFDEAIELDAEAAFLYKQRGNSFHALGQYAAAVRDFDEAIRLNGEDVNAYYNRGASHFALQDYVATVADYDAVIQLDPELVEAYTKRADAHEALGNEGEAARDRATAAVFESNRDNPR